MNKKLLLIMLFYISCLYPENYMNQLVMLTGEHNASEFGHNVTCLDFNGDGIDDLVVGANEWDPDYNGSDPSPWGKIYFYFGKEENFGDSVDLSFDNYDERYGLGMHLENLGDMNNDGCEDLGYYSYHYAIMDTICHIYYETNILFGNDHGDLEVDYTYTFSPGMWGWPQISWLGDINNDSYADAGISHCTNSTDSSFFRLIFGNDYLLYYLPDFEWGYCPPDIHGVGDINNDNYDDFVISYTDYTQTYQCLYWGCEDISVQPDIILNHFNTNSFSWCGCRYIGDWNGDGFDDFLEGPTVEGCGIIFGPAYSGSDFTPDFYIDYHSHLYRETDFGDFNNDGFTDMVGGNHFDDGRCYIYLGPQNGLSDLIIQGTIFSNAGWSVAVGDLNNDGYDDVAVGMPALSSEWIPGYVRVYAGNGDLEEADPGVGTEDDTLAENVELIEIYPNPVKGRFNFKLPAVYRNKMLELNIYNIRGQKVFTRKLASNRSGDYMFETDKIGMNSSGVYYLQFIDLRDNAVVSNRKISILK